MDRRAFLRMAAAAPVAAPVLAAEAAKAPGRRIDIILDGMVAARIQPMGRYAGGPEAIMPLRRAADGTLGLSADAIDAPLDLPADLDARVRDLVERGIRPCDLTRSEA